MAKQRDPMGAKEANNLQVESRVAHEGDNDTSNVKLEQPRSSEHDKGETLSYLHEVGERTARSRHRLTRIVCLVHNAWC